MGGGSVLLIILLVPRCFKKQLTYDNKQVMVKQHIVVSETFKVMAVSFLKRFAMCLHRNLFKLVISTMLTI